MMVGMRGGRREKGKTRMAPNSAFMSSERRKPARLYTLPILATVRASVGGPHRELAMTTNLPSPYPSRCPASFMAPRRTLAVSCSSVDTITVPGRLSAYDNDGRYRQMPYLIPLRTLQRYLPYLPQRPVLVEKRAEIVQPFSSAPWPRITMVCFCEYMWRRDGPGKLATNFAEEIWSECGGRRWVPVGLLGKESLGGSGPRL